MTRRPTRLLTAALAVVATFATVLLVPTTAALAADPTPDAQNAVNYAAANGYRSAIAVVDNENGRITGAGDIDAQYVTESLVKLFIATRLLAQGQMSGFNETTAYKMITQSDDAAANTLYGRVGGDGILPWTAQRYGIGNLGAPPPSPGYWGATRITARGLAQYYYAVRWDPIVWPWLSNALHNATPNGSDGFFQFFGIPSATTGFGVKQGWGDDTPTGVPEQNSTGVVDGDRFAVIILTQGPGYGGALSTMVTTEARLLMPGGLLNVNRFGVVDSTGTALAKDGTVSSGWFGMAGKVKQVAMDGTRYAVVDQSGTLLVKDGALNSPAWIGVASGVAQVAITEQRLAVLDTQGRVYVKDGPINGQWVLLADNVTQMAFDGARIGILTANGTFRMKEGTVFAPWVVMAEKATDIAVRAFRIGFLTADGTATVKDGALRDPWVVQRTDARDLQVTRSRIAIMTKDNTVVVKDGTLFAAWVTQAINVESMTVRDNRIGVHGFDDVVLVKQGFLSAPWIKLYAPAVSLTLG